MNANVSAFSLGKMLDRGTFGVQKYQPLVSRYILVIAVTLITSPGRDVLRTREGGVEMWSVNCVDEVLHVVTPFEYLSLTLWWMRQSHSYQAQRREGILLLTIWSSTTKVSGRATYYDLRELDGQLSHSVKTNTHDNCSYGHVWKPSVVFVRYKGWFQFICQFKKSIRHLSTQQHMRVLSGAARDHNVVGLKEEVFQHT